MMQQAVSDVRRWKKKKYQFHSIAAPVELGARVIWRVVPLPAQHKGHSECFTCAVNTPLKRYVWPLDCQHSQTDTERVQVFIGWSERATYLQCQCLFKPPKWTKLHQFTSSCLSNFSFLGQDLFNPSLASFRKLGHYFRCRSAKLFQKHSKWHWNFFCNKHKDSPLKKKKRCIIIAHHSITFVRRICCPQCYLKCLHATEWCM